MNAETCAHKGCHCSTTRPEAVTRDGKRFCCEACARGAGCHHTGCTCGQKH